MTFKAGTAKIIITPPVGVELAGYSFGPSLGILNELEAQALVLENDRASLAILTADLLAIGPELAARVRQKVETRLGVPGSRVLLSASHTHSGPATMPFRTWGAVDPAYLCTLEDALARAIGMAHQNLREARLGFGSGIAAGISANRRGRPASVDPAVAVLQLEDPSGQPTAVLFNFGSHPVTLHSYRGLITPDYPGYARQTIRDILGKEVTAMFTLGPAGDINPAGYIPLTFTPRRSWQIGAILGCEVAKIALTPAVQAEPEIRVVSVVVDLPVEPLPSVQQLQQLQAQFTAQADQLRSGSGTWEAVARVEIQREWAADCLEVWKKGLPQTSLPCELMGVRLGNAVLLAAPLELFTETGLAIKAASPAALTMICSNSNGALGYLPTLDAYQEEDYTNPQGVAPKVYGIYAFSPQAEPLFRQQAIRLVKDLFA